MLLHGISHTKKEIINHYMHGNDLIGQKFGMLTVTAKSSQRKNGYIMWECSCDCGNHILAESRHLKRGTIRDCGCSSVRARKDLTGQRFGRLVVLGETEKRDRDGNVIWSCLCDCGNTAEVPGSSLTKGVKKSCGCLKRPPLKDWEGKRFGRLTVQSYAGKRDGNHYWHCRCDCGSELDVRQTNLQCGHTKSCGCLADLAGSRHYVDGTCIELIRSGTVSKNNTSGIRGVYWNRKNERWIAHITFKKKRYYLGSYQNLEDAAEARRQGEAMYADFLEWYGKEMQADG